MIKLTKTMLEKAIVDAMQDGLGLVNDISIGESQ